MDQSLMPVHSPAHPDLFFGVTSPANSAKFETKDNVFIDLFCGGGGSGTGILDGLESIGIDARGTFINHSPHAISTHSLNHPDHRHFCTGVDSVDPESLFPEGVRPLLLWASPECTNFSKARAAAPVSPQSRATPECVLRWIKSTQPRHFICENVPQFIEYGPLRQQRNPNTGQLQWFQEGSSNVILDSADLPGVALGLPASQRRAVVAPLGFRPVMVPDKSRVGAYFARWVRKIRRQGYHVDWRVLCSADYGDPTIRQRLFVQAVRVSSGLKIVWPEPTHAVPDVQGNLPPGKSPWVSAWNVIDWSIPNPSIFRRERPYKEKTIRRIAIGMARFGFPGGRFDSPSPFNSPQFTQSTGVSLDEPLGAVVAGAKHYLVEPSIVKLRGTATAVRLNSPCPTVSAQGTHLGLNTPGACPMEAVEINLTRVPLSRLPDLSAAAHFINYFVEAFAKYHPDQRIKAAAYRGGGGTIYPAFVQDGVTYIVDSGFRMLSPRELARAQGFRNEYQFPGGVTDQIRAIGNAVTRRVARALTVAAISQNPNVDFDND